MSSPGVAADRPHPPLLPGRPARRRIAVATLVWAGVLVLGAYLGTGVLALAAALGVAAVAAGWAPLLALPSPRGTTSSVALGGGMCLLAVALTRREPLLEWLALALAASVLVEFVHQLARRDGRPRLTESVTGVLVAVAALASHSSVLALPRTSLGAAAVAVAVAPVALALAVQAGALPVRAGAALGVAVAVGAGALLSALLAEGPGVAAGALSGGLAALAALSVHRLLVVLPGAGWRPGWLALAAAPLASSGMVSYLVLRLVAR